MSRKIIALLGFSGLTLAALTSAAAADVVTVTYTGVVTSATDPNGVFGCTSTCGADNPYDGYTYTATYEFNTALGLTQNNSAIISATGGTSQPPSAQFGSPPQPPPSPLLSDLVTISNGTTTKTYNLITSFNATISNTSSDLLGGAPYTLVADVTDSNGNEIKNTAVGSNFPYSITQPFGPLTPDGGGFGEVSFDCTAGACNGFLSADFTSGTVSLSDISSAVPEPSTWAMMILGLLGIGVVGRRQKTDMRLV